MKLTALILTLLISALSVGCATNGGGDYCANGGVIYVSSNDELSERTKVEILKNNEKYAAICVVQK